MATVNRLIGWVSAGALLGLFAASLLAPTYIGWDNTPGSGQALCDCAKVSRETASRLLGIQAESAGVGGGMFLVVGIVMEVRRRKKVAVPATAT
jgi:hypothetical protein